MKTRKLKSLAILQANGKQFPRSPISLLDIMREFIADNMCQWQDMIERLLEQTDKPAGALLSKKESKRIKHNFDIYFGNDCECEKLGWEEMESRRQHVQFLLSLMLDKKFHAKKPQTFEEINRAIFELKLAFFHALATHKFVMIETSKCDFLEHKNLFGKQVAKTFPSARDEIKAAGNCLAMDLNTAAVFHLMRAAEIGMRALAVNLGVKLTYKGKPKPIEHGVWDQIITQIENKIRERHEKYKPAKPPVGVPAPSAKAKKMGKKEFEFLKFCRMMANELFIFKEIWRNNTMHSITSYNESEAKGVFDRVRDFMQRLSSKVSETNR